MLSINGRLPPSPTLTTEDVSLHLLHSLGDHPLALEEVAEAVEAVDQAGQVLALVHVQRGRVEDLGQAHLLQEGQEEVDVVGVSVVHTAHLCTGEGSGGVWPSGNVHKPVNAL